jgi:glycosyltransferase involved in cell wall biosynthesis
MTNPDRLVSVGLPVFNGEDSICQALDSLLAQSYSNFEVNISDNASTDRTREICLSYCGKDERIRYHQNPVNLGILPNWRRVLELASGEYFMWAAHDDYWSPNYIETLLDCLLAHPQAVLAAGKTEYVDGTGRLHHGMEPDHAPRPSKGGRADIARQLLLQHATNWLHGLYRRHELLKLPPTLFVEDAWGSDVLFLLETCLSHPVVGTEQAVMHKRVGTQRGAPQTPKDRVRWQCWFAGALLRVIVRSPLPLGEKLAVSQTYFRYLKWLYFRKGLRSWLTVWARAGYQCLRRL